MRKIDRDTWMDALEESSDVAGPTTVLHRLTNSDLGPFLLLSCLFIAAFIMFAAGMIFLVIGGPLALLTFFVVPLLGVVVEGIKRSRLKNGRTRRRGFIVYNTEKWVIELGSCLPQKHREAVVGDILEDISEMRETGLAERRIFTRVLWEWAISAVTLIPACLIGAIGRLWGAK